MSEKIRKGIVFGALFLAIIWGIYNFLPKSAPNPEAQSAIASPALMPATARMTTIEKTINIAEMKSKGWGDDPFRARDKITDYREKTEPPRWRLSGIVYNSIKPLAIINGKSVTVGSKMSGATIMEIKRESVVLEHSGTLVTLKVSKG